MMMIGFGWVYIGSDKYSLAQGVCTGFVLLRSVTVAMALAVEEGGGWDEVLSFLTREGREPELQNVEALLFPPTESEAE